MKFYIRHCCSIVLLLLAALSAHGQVGEQLHDFSIGVNGGINLSQISFTPKINQTYLMGPTAGLTLRYTSERYFGILCAFQAELNLNRTGWKEDIYAQNNEKLPDKYERELTYVSLPILASLGFGRKDRGAKGPRWPTERPTASTTSCNSMARRWKTNLNMASRLAWDLNCHRRWDIS